MDDVLLRIKRAILAGDYRFTAKAVVELDADHIDRSDVVESILEANDIYKTVRSRSIHRLSRSEKLYVIRSMNWEGVPIYTKGKLFKDDDGRSVYLLISSKRSDQ